jgi:hypothetical protein
MGRFENTVFVTCELLICIIKSSAIDGTKQGVKLTNKGVEKISNNS